MEKRTHSIVSIIAVPFLLVQASRLPVPSGPGLVGSMKVGRWNHGGYHEFSQILCCVCEGFLQLKELLRSGVTGSWIGDGFMQMWCRFYGICVWVFRSSACRLHEDYMIFCGRFIPARRLFYGWCP